MRIAQVLLASASEYERKSQRIDAESLMPQHEVRTLSPDGAAPSSVTSVRLNDLSGALAAVDIVHLYSSATIPARIARRIPVPCVASAAVHTSRLPWRRPSAPERLISPLGPGAVQEAVEKEFFAGAPAGPGTAGPDASGQYRVGVLSGDRRGVQRMVDLTRVRLERFRGDIQWVVFGSAPTPAQLAALHLWVDPAVSETDFDGFAAEALVIGLPVVAARTPINIERLNSGRNGLLTPAEDPNELTHAILAALFKPEVREPKREFARLTRNRFRPDQRAESLVRIYEQLVQ
jgi:hypothetical protein